ncbi:MAG: TniQ family protein [Methylotenera sp.]
MNKLLLRTPKPHALESFRGYLLRLAETNGLSSPSPILKLAGVNVDRIRCAEQPVEVLSTVTGHDVKSLAHLPLVHPISNIQQVSGHAVSKGYSIISKPKICPCCINEQGFAPAYWDLIAVQGCYKHQQSLISSCPQCNSDLSWIRPGLLTCECGADLSKLTGSPMSQEELEFLKIIDAKFNGLVLEDTESITGLPFKHLTEISLSTILAIVHTLGSIHLLIENKVERAMVCTNINEVKYGLEVLKDWPNNFFKLMYRLGEQQARPSLGLDRQFSFFTQRLFKRGYPTAEIKFIKEAFVEFGQNHWGNAFYYSRMQSKPDSADQPNFVGVYELAKRIGHTPSAVRTMIDEGRLVAKGLEGSKIEKVIIDLAKSNVKIPEKGNTVSVRDAAKYLELPVSVLSRLRDLGHYQPDHLTLDKNSYCIEDLLTLKKKILNCQLVKLPNEQLITIAFIMRKSFRSYTFKTTIIEKILDRSLACFGCEKDINAIQVRLSDFEALASNVLPVDRGWLTIKQTSIELQCDNGIIKNMIEAGLIEGQKEKGVQKINIDSVSNFKQRYVTLQQLSSTFKLGVLALNHLCYQQGLALLSVKRNYNVCQNFIRRSDVHALAQHVKDYYLNHKKLAYRCRLESINLDWMS